MIQIEKIIDLFKAYHLYLNVKGNEHVLTKLFSAYI